MTSPKYRLVMNVRRCLRGEGAGGNPGHVKQKTKEMQLHEKTTRDATKEEVKGESFSSGCIIRRKRRETCYCVVAKKRPERNAHTIWVESRETSRGKGEIVKNIIRCLTIRDEEAKKESRRRRWRWEKIMWRRKKRQLRKKEPRKKGIYEKNRSSNCEGRV